MYAQFYVIADTPDGPLRHRQHFRGLKGKLVAVVGLLALWSPLAH